ncbi:MAG: hypothetical protein ABW185_04595, partial [Sedimenticola sp.]
LDLIVGPPPNTIRNVCPVQYIEWVQSAMQHTHEFVHRNLGKAATRQKGNYDQGLRPRAFESGDWVWRWYPPTANKKLGLGWTGPYLIIRKVTSLTYSIQKKETSPIINVHVDHLAPYRGINAPASWVRPEPDPELELSQNPETETTQLLDIPMPDPPRPASPVPQVRTRVGRAVKPREIYSP